MNHYILDFPCNGCCLGANNTLIERYQKLENETKAYKLNLLISVVYLLLQIVVEQKKIKKNASTKNKVKFNYKDITIFF